MCEMVDPYTSRSAKMACAATMQTKNYREIHKRGYEGQIEDPYPGEKMQRTRGPVQINEQIHIQVGVEEAPKKLQVKYLQLHFIPSL